jgi:hypothetical protein
MKQIYELSEKKLHKQICDYLKLQYPKVIFNTDLSGLKLTIGQATQLKNLRSSTGFPDIMIFHAKKCGVVDFEIKGENYSVPAFNFCGLFLEVKKESPFLKNGNLKENEHLKEQQFVHEKLRKQGYLTLFVWNFDDAKYTIDNYLKD